MAMKQELRVGFIGAGWTQRVQIPVFRMGGLAPHAICAGHVENAQAAATLHGVPHVFATWQELVACDAVDIVSIVTPPHLHKSIAVAALDAGKHVICEKPAALNVAEVEEMMAAAQAAPGQLAIIDHELRFHPARLKLRELLRDGYVGSLLNIEFRRHSPERLDPRTPWNWYSDRAQGGGMLFAIGSHLLDLARWMVGRMDMLTAQLSTGHAYRPQPNSEQASRVTSDDHAQILLQFANGAKGLIVVDGLTPGPRGMTIEARGTHGMLRLDAQDQLWGIQAAPASSTWMSDQWQPIRTAIPGLNLDALPARTPFAVGSFFLAQTVATSLIMGETVVPEAASFYDGLVVQRALEAARTAAAEQRWVRL